MSDNEKKEDVKALLRDILAHDDRVCKALTATKVNTLTSAEHQEWKATQKSWDAVMNRVRGVVLLPESLQDKELARQPTLQESMAARRQNILEMLAGGKENVTMAFAKRISYSQEYQDEELFSFIEQMARDVACVRLYGTRMALVIEDLFSPYVRKLTAAREIVTQVSERNAKSFLEDKIVRARFAQNAKRLTDMRAFLDSIPEKLKERNAEIADLTMKNQRWQASALQASTEIARDLTHELKVDDTLVERARRTRFWAGEVKSAFGRASELCQGYESVIAQIQTEVIDKLPAIEADIK